MSGLFYAARDKSILLLYVFVLLSSLHIEAVKSYSTSPGADAGLLRAD